MDTTLTLTAIIVLVVQYFSSKIVIYVRAKHTREISKFIMELYQWLFKSTFFLYTLTFTGKIQWIPISLDISDIKLIIAITLYATILLLFFPLKLLWDKIIHFKVTY